MAELISDLDTPAVLIEKSVLEKNIFEMQKLADKHKVKLRSHVKTHKIPKIAKLQLEAGACGIACAKVSEAEVMARAGFRDIQIANIIVGDIKIERMARLMDVTDRLSCCVDSIEGAEQIGKAMSLLGKTMHIFIKVDTGFHRVGVEKYEDILMLSQIISQSDGIKLEGILTHAGQVYEAGNPQQIEAIAIAESRVMIDMARKLGRDGIPVPEISVGSTPGSEFAVAIPGITELRAGNYALRDMIQVSFGTSKIEQCAMSILATVVSVPGKGRAVIDAGSKTLNLDRGAHSSESLDSYGYIIGKNAKITKLSEEHGMIEFENESFTVGEKIRVIPNHACTVMNLHDHAFLVDGVKVLKKMEISARGKIH